MTTAALAFRILGADSRGAWNRLRRRRLAGLLVAVGLFWLAIALATGVALGAALAQFRDFFGVGGVEAIVAFGFTALAVVMLVFGFSTVVSAFYADRDLLLLATAPLRPAAIYAARLLRAGWANSLMAVLLLSGLVGYGAGSGYGAGYFATAAGLVVMEVLAITALQVVLLGAVVRVTPARRIKDAANMVSAVAATAFYVSWLALRSPVASGHSQELLAGARGFASVGRRVELFPTAWPAQALVGWGSAQAARPALAMLGMSAVLVTGSFLLFRVTFANGLAAFLETGSRRQAGRRQSTLTSGGSVTAAIVTKDLLTLRRDGRRLVRLLPGAVLAFAYPLLFFRTPGSSGFWVIGIVPWFLAQLFGLPAVAAEGRALHLLRLASVSPARLLRAKILGAAVPVGVLSLLAAGLIVIFQGAGGMSPWIVGTTAWLGAGFSIISVGAGALSPRLDADDPRRAVGFEGVLVALVGGAVFGVLTLLGIGGLYLALVLSRTGHPLGAAPWVSLLPAWSFIAGVVFLGLAVAPPVIVAVTGARALGAREP